MSFLSDLDHLKIETIFQPDHVCTPGFFSDPRRGIRKAKIERRWYRKKSLGTGSFGEVWLEEEGSDSSQMRAVKIIKKAQMLRHDIDYMRELNALAHFSKPKYRQESLFVDFYGWYDDDATVYLAMEYFPLGDLDRFINSDISEGGVREIASQLLQGLCFMHGEGYAHRDLKPGNVFVIQKTPTWWVKIGDFGISKKIADANTAFRTIMGTRDYMAPELFHYLDSQEEDEDEYSNAVDIWAVGCIIFKLIAKKPPFPPGTSLRKYCVNQELFPSEVIATRTSTSGLDFLKGVLAPEPAERPIAKEALKDQWITSVSAIETSNLDGKGPLTETPDTRGDSEAKTIRPEYEGRSTSQDIRFEAHDTLQQALNAVKATQDSRVMESSRDSSLNRQTHENEKSSELAEHKALVKPGVDSFMKQSLGPDHEATHYLAEQSAQRLITRNTRIGGRRVSSQQEPLGNTALGRTRSPNILPASGLEADFAGMDISRVSPEQEPLSNAALRRTRPPNFPPTSGLEAEFAGMNISKVSPAQEPLGNTALGQQRSPNLPPVTELDARIQEASTSAMLLTELIKTYEADGTGSELIREFKDRCHHAQRSISRYIAAESDNQTPGGELLPLLLRTYEELSHALTRWLQLPTLTDITSPEVAVEGTSRQSGNQNPGAPDATRVRRRKSREKKQLQPVNQPTQAKEKGPLDAIEDIEEQASRQGGADRARESFWKKLENRHLGQHAVPGQPLPGHPPGYDSNKFYTLIKLQDNWGWHATGYGLDVYTHKETGCILYIDPLVLTLPSGWEMRVKHADFGSRPFYVDHNTRTTSWTFPTA